MKAQAHRLLVIEDDPKAVFLLQETLSDSKDIRFELVAEHTLDAGLRAIEKGGVDVLLLDLNLPDSHGFTTFERAQEVAPHLPIIVLTGSDDDSFALRAMHGGAQDYLIKGKTDRFLLVKSLLYAIERKRIQSQLEAVQQETECRVQERTAELQAANERLHLEINERAQAETALRESKRLLEEALNQLKRTQEEVIRRERLHALGNMASGIAHDFNNALPPILGFSELLLLKEGNLDDHDKVRRYLEMIRASAQDASAVVGRLREFYRERDGREARTDVAINDLISKALLLTKPRWRDQAMASGINITIETDFRSIPPLTGNPDALQEMFTNLLLNSVEALGESGTIAVRTWSESDDIHIEFRDTGQGMSEETRLRCVDPFYSTKGTEGSGFGLPTTYGIVKRHGGRFEIESAPGQGTTIRIALPASGKETDPDVPRRPYEGDPLRILVVDDEPLMREVIVACLVGDGHRVKTASDGVQAMKIFSPDQFDLVITDRAMPHMNGDQLAREIKAVAPNMFVILLTGFGSLMAASGEHPECIDLIVSKPFTIEGLRQAIGHALAAPVT